MDERVVVPSTSVLLVLVVGMVAGHVMMPAGAALGTRVAFAGLVGAAGAIAGWRTDRVMRAPGGRWPAWASAVAGAGGAWLLAWAGYAFVHG